MAAKWLIIGTVLNVAACMSANNNSTVILICYDGVDKLMFDNMSLPNFKKFFDDGVSSEGMKPVYPTKTWPNIHTLMTGQYADSHGIVSNIIWDPLFKLFWRYNHPKSKETEGPLFFNTSEPLWLTNENQGGRSASYHWPGAGFYSPRKPSFYEPEFDIGKLISPTLQEFLWKLKAVVNSTTEKMRTALKSPEPPNFVSFYIDFPDGIGHLFGPDSIEYQTSLKFLDSDIFAPMIRMLESEELYNKTNIIVVSDHGMWQPKASFKELLLAEFLDPSTYFLSEQGVVAHIWPIGNKEEEIITNLTTKAISANITVYRKKNIPNSYHWKHNRRIPPIVVLPKSGYIVRNTARKGPFISIGDHGFPVDWPRMNTIFFARGPAFQKGLHIKSFPNLAVYPLITHLLGIKAAPHNGTNDLINEVLLEKKVKTGGVSGHASCLAVILSLHCLKFMMDG